MLSLARTTLIKRLKNLNNKFSVSSFHSGSSQRYLTDVTDCNNIEFMQTRYKDLKRLINENYTQVCSLDSQGIFAINQINFADINVYGFDYDYTLAQYSDVMQDFIYEAATEVLVKKHNFPKQLLNFSHCSDFCIRGLHYDIQRSLLMKVDACNIIQLGTVYRGLQKLDDHEVVELFGGSRHIPKHILDQSYVGGDSIRQLMDIFSMPEMMLLSNVVEYFTSNNIVYDPTILFESVQDAVRSVHINQLHKEVINNVDKYLTKDSLRELTNYLVSSGKTLFLITNSGYEFVNCGLKHLIGPDWKDVFDVCIVQAKKPGFFYKGKRPFKRIITDSKDPYVSWEHVNNLTKGQVYTEGCISELMKLSKWNGSEVLYFGDQIYADLSDVTHAYGWRTGAVIPELEDELIVMNRESFSKAVVWLQTLEKLLERMQVYRDAECQQLIHDWLQERNELKVSVKEVFNVHFGSVFRSHLNASFFAGRLCRIADVYTSSINNLSRYYPDHFFFPLRGTLPHENIISLSFQHDGYDNAIEKALKDKRKSAKKFLR